MADLIKSMPQCIELVAPTDVPTEEQHCLQREMAMSLKTELDAFRADFMAKASPEVREAMARADAELAASGIAQRALKVGDRAPDFRLPNVRGDCVRLSDLLAKGPVVLSFYRGGLKASSTKA